MINIGWFNFLFLTKSTLVVNFATFGPTNNSPLSISIYVIQNSFHCNNKLQMFIGMIPFIETCGVWENFYQKEHWKSLYNFTSFLFTQIKSYTIAHRPAINSLLSELVQQKQLLSCIINAKREEAKAQNTTVDFDENCNQVWAGITKEFSIVNCHN